MGVSLRATGALLGALLIAGGLLVPGQVQPVGTDRPARNRPVVRTFSPQAYDGNDQVWDVAQDDRGLLYLASSYGLQQYDGARWRDFSTKNETTPWAIARDTTGTLYVGPEAGWAGTAPTRWAGSRIAPWWTTSRNEIGPWATCGRPWQRRRRCTSGLRRACSAGPTGRWRRSPTPPPCVLR